MAKQKISANTWPVRISHADLPAGANLAIRVPEDEVWEFISAQMVYTAIGAVETRNIRLIITDPDGIEISSSGFSDDITTTTPLTIQIARFATAPGTVNNVDGIGAPTDMIIPPRGLIATQVTDMNAGDIISEIRIFIKVFKASQ